jgi:hypothetical protein
MWGLFWFAILAIAKMINQKPALLNRDMKMDNLNIQKFKQRWFSFFAD